LRSSNSWREHRNRRRNMHWPTEPHTDGGCSV